MFILSWDYIGGKCLPKVSMFFWYFDKMEDKLFVKKEAVENLRKKSISIILKNEANELKRVAWLEIIGIPVEA